ncbi:uncharacterized protein KQ657_001702 [Scheffersomyces spartinae]|uniref:Replication factor C subunit 2 n=1 Tax=Scheffersomyces spartinae TaxID=45513 RepID=A0A9P7V7H5_9ASCO|nr:uncharacterized protein KQ657_001702 [Scheffersomyces spartinae]KAG7192602.1 hypothetical protein KQ657_001702 [Scheffersomyces spartinae]
MKDTLEYEQEKLDHTPWVEKYRPKKLDDVASQDHAVKVLQQNLSLANLPHMLFYGPPGTGKTSTILALAKQLYGPRLYKSRVLELNASDERGISIVREKIKNFARLTISNPTQQDLDEYPCPPYKIVILDEADSMTTDAQSALRRTMETYLGITRFCLICNYITRIIDPVASRCSKFRFKPLNNENALLRLQHVASAENVQLAPNEKVLSEILRIADGDLRKAITILQSAAKLHTSLNNNSSNNGNEDNDMDVDRYIDIASIQEIAGVVSDPVISQLLVSTASKDRHRLFANVNNIIQEGWSAQQLLDQLHDKYIMDDSLTNSTKNEIAKALFEADRKLNNGTDEHIQILSLLLSIQSVL